MIEPRALELHAITDNLRDGIDGLVSRARAARRGGASMIHVRLADESARTVVEVARALVTAVDAPVVVYRRVDVAIAAGAAGVHLAVDDVSVSDVRRIAGHEFVIGRSAGSEEELRRAATADYVAIGPVFSVGETRRERVLGLSEFERLARLTAVPVIAIGGITSATAGQVVRAGAAGVALISGIFGSGDPENATREVRSAIET